MKLIIFQNMCVVSHDCLFHQYQKFDKLGTPTKKLIGSLRCSEVNKILSSPTPTLGAI